MNNKICINKKTILVVAIIAVISAGAVFTTTQVLKVNTSRNARAESPSSAVCVFTGKKSDMILQPNGTFVLPTLGPNGTLAQFASFYNCTVPQPTLPTLISSNIPPNVVIFPNSMDITGTTVKIAQQNIVKVCNDMVISTNSNQNITS